MILADTSVWVDYLNRRSTPQTAILDRLLEDPDFAIGDVIVMECLRGIRRDDRLVRVREDFFRYDIVPIATTPVVLRAAEHYRFLRARGITIRGTVDCLIATFCIDGGHQLLHSDRDFDPFAQHLGLQVIRG